MATTGIFRTSLALRAAKAKFRLVLGDPNHLGINCTWLCNWGLPLWLLS